MKYNGEKKTNSSKNQVAAPPFIKQMETYASTNPKQARTWNPLRTGEMLTCFRARITSKAPPLPG
jgi:hypothetical protein